MLESRLDELGCHRFERFAQALLKADLGSGLEAWGDHGDWGRDSYSATALRFPNRELNDGPFVFQVKFVRNANAAGAKPFPALRKAVGAELKRIRVRCEEQCWEHPEHYVLVTNCPVGATAQRNLENLIAQVLPRSKIHILRGRDLTTLAAGQPNVRQAFPELLGLDDLKLLIVEATQKGLVQRSRALLESAMGVLPVFVPTRAYEQAWQVLRAYCFVTLEGPPEMGKTAIAEVIAALKWREGWDIYECREPSDMFELLDDARQQLFFADDAFGRTEYDPSLGRLWERDLDKLLRRLNTRRWLIWTSRRHILKRALHHLDLQGIPRTFPSTASVLVDASALALPEKLEILFRHARHACLKEPLKNSIRKNGRNIVRHAHFTPERIRRFVTESLAAIHCGHPDEAPTSARISQAIEQEIANPTERMRKSFRALSLAHKAFLFALVESGGEHVSTVVAYHRLAELHHCDIAMDRIVDELCHSFILPNYGWTHPSVRDLVIDELSSSSQVRRLFLRNASVRVVKLALSEEGGATGTRTRPLLCDAGDWEELMATCRRLLTGTAACPAWELIMALRSVSVDGLDASRSDYEKVVRLVCETVTAQWSRSKAPCSVDLFESVAKLSIRIKPLPALPDPQSLWDETIANARAAPQKCDEDAVWCLSDLLYIVRVLTQYEPRFLSQVGFPERQAAVMEVLHRRLVRYLSRTLTVSSVSGDMAHCALRCLNEGKDIPSLAEAYAKLHKKHASALRRIEWHHLTKPDEERETDYMRTKVLKHRDAFTDSMIEAVLHDL